jgi:hypothetical protein
MSVQRPVFSGDEVMQRRNERRKVKSRTARMKTLVKSRHKLILSLALLSISTPLLIIQIIRIANALSVWSSLKIAAERPPSDLLPYERVKPKSVEDALHAVDDEERRFILPCLLVGVSLIGALHSAEIRITPQRCFYCHKWIRGKDAKQSPDKAFHYHEKCEPREGEPSKS